MLFFLAIFIIGYTYLADTYCHGDGIENDISDLSTAIDECNQRPDCGCVENYKCDGSYYLAKGGNTKHSSWGSCSWVRLRNII